MTNPNKKAAQRADYNVSPEDFIRAWQSSETAQEVADKLKMPKAIVLARASKYRQDGVKLKKVKKRHKRKLDVAELNKMIEQLESEPAIQGNSEESERIGRNAGPNLHHTQPLFDLVLQTLRTRDPDDGEAVASYLEKKVEAVRRACREIRTGGNPEKARNRLTLLMFQLNEQAEECVLTESVERAAAADRIGKEKAP